MSPVKPEGHSGLGRARSDGRRAVSIERRSAVQRIGWQSQSITSRTQPSMAAQSQFRNVHTLAASSAVGVVLSKMVVP